ncbi:MAG: hypothetical protein AAF988_00815 [Pseudomonadota bacterium]
MLKVLFPKKNNYLGIALKKSRYDFPLENSSSNKFIKILIALMTILLVFAFSGAFVLNDIATSWSQGLEGKATIEIPAKDQNGALLGSDILRKQSADIENIIKESDFITQHDVLSEEALIERMEPWLGDLDGSSFIANAPLPIIHTISFNQQNSEFELKGLERSIQEIAPQARIDTHESWLNSILSLTNILNITAYVMIFLISITTIIAIIGSVRTRLSTYAEQLELLHLMGASDVYITKQFQHHMALLALKGSVFGLIIASLILLSLKLFMADISTSLFPTIEINAKQIWVLLSLPILATILTIITVRLTVLRRLAQMP